MHFDLDYIFLYTLVVFVSVRCGLNVSNNKPYWKSCLLLILTYTFVCGSRYGRGTDYFIYLDIFDYGSEYSQLTFTSLISTLKYLGVDAYHAYYVYSLIFIICGLSFVKQFRQYAKYIIPLFVIETLIVQEQYVRQVLGFSVMLLIFNYLEGFSSIKDILQKKISLFFIVFFLALSLNTHFANFFILFIFALFFFLYPHTIPLKLSIPIYLAAIFLLGSVIDLSSFNSILSLMGGEHERIQSYVDHTNKWFGSGGMNANATRNGVVLIIEAIGNLSLIYYGKMIIDSHFPNNRNIITFYNCYIFGEIILNSFRTLELLCRMGLFFQMFCFIPLGLVLYYRKEFIYDKKGKYAYYFLIWWLYDFIKYILMSDMTEFLWDNKINVM